MADLHNHVSAESLDLKPCPFCGATKLSEEGNKGWPVVQCDDCGACGPCINLDRDKANATWNARITDDAQPSVEAMKAAVELEIHTALGRVQTVEIGRMIQKAIDASRPQCSAASEPVAYLHQCRDSVAEPQLGFEVARNPQWTSEPLYRAVPQAVPEGYALVPLTPTPEMIEVGCDNNPTQWNEGTNDGFAADVASDVYVSMVRAASQLSRPQSRSGE